MIDLKKGIEKSRNFFIIVEGKNDKKALLELGFIHIFIIHESGKSIYEKIEQIEFLAENKKICILTDFDKKGKKLYLLLKSELSKRKVHVDNTFRGMLLKSGISHIEGLSSYMKNKENGKNKKI